MDDLGNKIDENKEFYNRLIEKIKKSSVHLKYISYVDETEEIAGIIHHYINAKLLETNSENHENFHCLAITVKGKLKIAMLGVTRYKFSN